MRSRSERRASRRSSAIARHGSGAMGRGASSSAWWRPSCCCAHQSRGHTVDLGYALTAPTSAGATRAERLGNPGEHARLQWLHRIQPLPATKALPKFAYKRTSTSTGRATVLDLKTIEIAPQVDPKLFVNPDQPRPTSSPGRRRQTDRPDPHALRSVLHGYPDSIITQRDRRFRRPGDRGHLPRLQFRPDATFFRRGTEGRSQKADAHRCGYDRPGPARPT